MPDGHTLTAEIVRLRDAADLALAFWQIAALLNARYPGLTLTAAQARDGYGAQRLTGGLRLASRPFTRHA